MASLAGLTSRLAKGTGRMITGTAANIYSSVKGAVVSSTGIGMLRPTNIAAAIMDKAGLSPFIPSITGAFRPTGGAPPRSMSGQATGDLAQQPFNQPALTASADITKTLSVQTNILSKILDVNKNILDFTEKDSKSIELTSSSLSDLLVFLKADSIKRQEDAREAKVARTVAANDNTKGAAKTAGVGGGLMGLLSMIPGFGALKTIFSGITSAFETILKFGGILLRGLLSIGRFLIRFAGPVGAVIGVLLALESQDWEKFFGRFTDAFKDFMEGNWISGIVKVVIAIPELLVKGVGRIIARIAEFFGFEKFAKALDEVIDNFDLLEILKTIFNYVKDTFIYIKDTVVNFFSNAKDKIAEWWDSFSIIDPIIDTFTYVKDSVVNLFTDVKDKVAEWFNSAADLGSKIGENLGNMVNNVWEFFKSLPGKLVDAASNLIPDFIKEPFKKLFGSGTSQQTTQPTPQAPTTAPAVRATTPAIPSTEADTQRYIGMTKEQIKNDILPRVGGDATKAETEAEKIFNRINNITNTTTTTLQPVPGGRENVFNAESSRQAVEQNAAVTTPVIINNSSSSSGGSVPAGRAETRSGGAVSTSPRDSHIDRALYGNAYGAGVP